MNTGKKLTFKDFRENFGFSLEEVASRLAMPVERLRGYEDTADVSADEFAPMYATFVGVKLSSRDVTPLVTGEQHTELMAYWEMKKQLLDIIFTISNEEYYPRDRINNDLAQILTLVDVREKEAMSAITAAYTASVSHLR
ncbi:hypothetical protein QP794_02715 [Paenibacillus sp. UMB7766-LJ446]|uniref:hypothetical protein n=1 Tax=Paenibacillus sp. UMB7766-LJ446 TaxID=3046313 RepID=UPI00254F1F46|nr:hypothetical protein [Paenibacillus sp. UMB7766-LJ446]MDK8188998.1 hypothetical protein [Paenibacillus sp. UMB7766-LJ446]